MRQAGKMYVSAIKKPYVSFFFLSVVSGSFGRQDVQLDAVMWPTSLLCQVVFRQFSESPSYYLLLVLVYLFV